VYPRILDENGNIKDKVSSSPEGSMVIEAISAKGCDVVVKKEDVEKVGKLKKWGSYLFKFGKMVINLVM
jgi:hypothetical protein